MPLSDERFLPIGAREELTNGIQILLTARNADGTIAAIGREQRKNVRDAVRAFQNDDGMLVPENTACALTLWRVGDYWALYDPNLNGCLYAASSSGNYLRTQTENDENGLWNIDFAADGTATLTAVGKNANRCLRYREAAGAFDCARTAEGGFVICRLLAKPVVEVKTLGAQARLDGVRQLRFGATLDAALLKACIGTGETAQIGFWVNDSGEDAIQGVCMRTEIVWDDAMQAAEPRALAALLAARGVSLYGQNGSELTYVLTLDADPSKTYAFLPFVTVGERTFFGKQKTAVFGPVPTDG